MVTVPNEGSVLCCTSQVVAAGEPPAHVRLIWLLGLMASGVATRPDAGPGVQVVVLVVDDVVVVLPNGPRPRGYTMASCRTLCGPAPSVHDTVTVVRL